MNLLFTSEFKHLVDNLGYESLHLKCALLISCPFQIDNYNYCYFGINSGELAK